MADDHQQPGALGKPDNGRNPANAEVDSLVSGIGAQEEAQSSGQPEIMVEVAQPRPAAAAAAAPIVDIQELDAPGGQDLDRSLLSSIDKGVAEVSATASQIVDILRGKGRTRSANGRSRGVTAKVRDPAINSSRIAAEQAPREGATHGDLAGSGKAYPSRQRPQNDLEPSPRTAADNVAASSGRSSDSRQAAPAESSPSDASSVQAPALVAAATSVEIPSSKAEDGRQEAQTSALFGDAEATSLEMTREALEKLPLRDESGQFISKEQKQSMSGGELQQARMRQERKEKQSQERQEGLISQLAHTAESVITEGGDAVDAAGTAAGGAYYSAGKELYTAYQQVAGEDSKIRQSFEWLKEKASSSSDSADAEVAPAEAGSQKITDSLSLAMAEARSEKAADLDGGKEQVGLLKRMAAYLGLIADKSEDQKSKTQAASIQETREKETLSDSISVESENQIEVIRQTSSEAATRESESHTENQESMAEINSTLEDGFESVSSSVTSASGGRGGGLLDLLGLGGERRGRRGGRGRGGGRLARAGRMAGVAGGARGLARGAGGLARGALTAGSRLLGPLAALAAGGMAWNNTRNELADREDLSDEQKSTIAASTGIGAGGGALGGALAGGAAGAAIGSVVPVVGTLIGGAIGSVVGGLAGAWGGERAGRAVGEMIAGDGEEQFEEALYDDVEQAQDGAVDAMSEDRARMTGSAASSEDGLLSRIAREETNASEGGLLSRVADPDSSNLADSTLAAGSASQQTESKGLLGRAAELLGPEGLGRMNPLVNAASSLFGRGRNPSAEDQAGEARSEPRGFMSRVVDSLGPEGLGRISPIAGMLGANQGGGLLGRLFGRGSQESVSGEAEASEGGLLSRVAGEEIEASEGGLLSRVAGEEIEASEGGLLSRVAGEEIEASEGGLLSRVQESMESIADAAPAASQVESGSAEAVSGGAVIEQQSIEPVNPKDAAKALQQNIVVQQPKEPRQKNAPSSSDRELMLSSKSGGGAKSALGNASAQGVKEITADFSETVLTLMAMDRI